MDRSEGIVTKVLYFAGIGSAVLSVFHLVPVTYNLSGRLRL